MSEKTSHGPVMGDGQNDNFFHPTAPPSYDEAMEGGHSSQSTNPPVNPYQGYPGPVVPNPVPMPTPHMVPVYPNQQMISPNPAVPYGMQPSQMMNVPNPPAQSHVVSVGVAPVPVGPKGMRIRCCHCGADIKTTTVTSNKASAHLACLILCIFTCCLCSWIPYCMNSCKRVDHKCPNCKGFLGSYNG